MSSASSDSWSVTSGPSPSRTPARSVASSFIRAKIDTRPRHALLPPVEEDEGDVRSLTELIDFNAKHNPNHIFALQTLKNFDSENNKGDVFLRITHSAFKDAVIRCQEWLKANVPGLKLPKVLGDGSIQKGPAMAVFMESDVGLFIYTCALIGLGVPAVIMSARLGPNAIENLLVKTGAENFLVSSRLQSKAEEGIERLAQDSVKPGLYQRVDFQQFLDNSRGEIDAERSSCHPHHYIAEDDLDVLVLHSSGTTGLPKPIYQPHRWALGFAACYGLSEEQADGKINYSTLPLYHGFGLLAPGLSMSVGNTVCFPPSSIIPNAGSTIKIMRLVRADSLMTVPLILEELSTSSDEVIKGALKHLQFVAWGGGPLREVVREKLAAMSIKLLNHSGATEVGALSSVFVPDKTYDSRYVRFRTDLGVRFDKVASEQGQPTQYKMIAWPFGWNKPFELQDKLVANPSQPETDFRILGRNDDLLVLASGEKVQPNVLETALNGHPKVRAALAFGEGEFELGVMVEPFNGVDDEDAYKALLWQTVAEAGEKMDAHARLSSQASILVVAPGSLPRTDKGSVARKEAYKKFERQIREVYDILENTFNMDDALSPTSPSLLDDLKGFIVKKLKWEKFSYQLTYESDFFEMGMDSLQAQQLRRAFLPTLIKSSAAITKAQDVPADFFYRYPSITAVATCLQSTNENSSTIEKKQQTIRDLVTQQLGELANMPHAACILLTGSTGSLGSHLVHHLLQSSATTRLICLVRKPNDKKLPNGKKVSTEAPLERQLRLLREKGLALSEDDADKLEVIETNTSGPYLGLPVRTYRDLCRNVTHILHNAWPVDFKRHLPSFQAQFDTLRQLIHLAREVHAYSPSVRPTMQFVSSIATIGRYGKQKYCFLVPEKDSVDVSCSNPFGYAEAKLVCEMMLDQARLSYGLEMEIRYVRVGQMSGSRTSGYWNNTEHFPALMKSSQKVGCLPNLKGTLSWITVDDAATCMSEILLSEPSPRHVFHLENPVRQSWGDAMGVLGRELNIKTFVPLTVWCGKVATSADDNNPAKQLLSFFTDEFEHNSSGEVIMDTANSRSASHCLASMGPVEPEVIESYVRSWRQLGFLL